MILNRLELDIIRIRFYYEIVGCETKPPILEWDKTVDFENGTKSPIHYNTDL